ncbi:MAG TPA: PhzF family phenazine biosynthesis protein [Candidatus Polarisedimenticolia bacterium]|nr:PhzF family phenazine biosynthesis protein [Candidatus Polarisedimenticolia bacterium]
MPIEILHVDAFSSRPFSGNPAAVCFLDEPMPDAWMQGVAAEMNLSETAFPLRQESGFRLRWFTPAAEVALCGHATLATAHALWETGRLDPASDASFLTRSGPLGARRAGSGIAIDLPAMALIEQRCPEEVLAALGIRGAAAVRVAHREGGEADWLLELESESAVRDARPDFGRLRQVQAGVIVTARGAVPPYDFVSRYFAPWWGIDEDPVTGAAHCSLVPYWASRLGRTEMTAFQASARGGVVRGRLLGDRVVLTGEAVTVARGALSAAVRTAGTARS